MAPCGAAWVTPGCVSHPPLHPQLKAPPLLSGPARWACVPTSALPVGLCVLPGTCRGQAHSRKQSVLLRSLVETQTEGTGLDTWPGPNMRPGQSPVLYWAATEDPECERTVSGPSWQGEFCCFSPKEAWGREGRDITVGLWSGGGVDTLLQLSHVSGWGLHPSLLESVHFGGMRGTCSVLDGIPGAFGGWSGAGNVGCFPFSSCFGGAAAFGRNRVGGQVLLLSVEIWGLAKSWCSLFWPLFIESRNNSVASFIQGSQTKWTAESTA